MAAAELLNLVPVIGAPNDPDFAVGFVLDIWRRLSVRGQIRLCQHILKFKPLHPRKLPRDWVGKRIRFAFSHLVAGSVRKPADQQRHILLPVEFQ